MGPCHEWSPPASRAEPLEASRWIDSRPTRLDGPHLSKQGSRPWLRRFGLVMVPETVADDEIGSLSPLGSPPPALGLLPSSGGGPRLFNSGIAQHFAESQIYVEHLLSFLFLWWLLTGCTDGPFAHLEPSSINRSSGRTSITHRSWEDWTRLSRDRARSAASASCGQAGQGASTWKRRCLEACRSPPSGARNCLGRR